MTGTLFLIAAVTATGTAVCYFSAAILSEHPKGDLFTGAAFLGASYAFLYLSFN